MRDEDYNQVVNEDISVSITEKKVEFTFIYILWICDWAKHGLRHRENMATGLGLEFPAYDETNKNFTSTQNKTYGRK